MPKPTPEPHTHASLEAIAGELEAMASELRAHAAALSVLSVNRFTGVRQVGRTLSFTLLRSFIEDVRNNVRDMATADAQGTLSDLSVDDGKGLIYRQIKQRKITKRATADKDLNGAKPKHKTRSRA